MAVSGISAWRNRYALSPDGLTYLDMAWETARNGAGSLINPMWSPLYPAYLSVWLGLLHPSAAQRIPIAHLATWLVSGAAAAAFCLFLKAWSGLPMWKFEPGACSRTTMMLLGFCVFAWQTLTMGIPGAISPDGALALFVFLAAWCCTKLVTAPGSQVHYVLLGASLAGAYYSKPAGFAIAVLLLVWLLVRSKDTFARSGVLLAFLSFSVAVLPLVCLVSRDAGHPTASDSGKLNYVWHVNGFHTFIGWTGEGSSLHGVPLHAPRVISTHPRMLEFAGPVKGTYPLWYNPAYWYDGVRPTFHVGEQLRAVLTNMRELYWGLWPYPLLWAGLAAICLLAFEGGRVWLPPASQWLIGWSVLVLGMCSIVHVEARYLGPFLALSVVAACFPLLRTAGAPGRGAALVVIIGALLSITALSGSSLAQIAAERRSSLGPYDQVMAERLAAFGLKPGDSIATAGYSFDASWAHVAGLRIAAQAVDGDEFWSADAQQVDELGRALRGHGIKAIVARGGPAIVSPGWQELPPRGNEPYRILLLE